MSRYDEYRCVVCGQVWDDDESCPDCGGRLELIDDETE